MLEALLIISALKHLGINYPGFYANVPRTQLFTLFLAITASKAWKIRYFDMVAVFLNPELSRPIRIELPGFQQEPGEVSIFMKCIHRLK